MAPVVVAAAAIVAAVVADVVPAVREVREVVAAIVVAARANGAHRLWLPIQKATSLPRK